MRGTRRITVMAAVGSLVAAGCITGFVITAVTASASGNNCTASTTAPTCSLDTGATSPDPGSVELLFTNDLTTDAASYTVSWTSQCNSSTGTSLGTWHGTAENTLSGDTFEDDVVVTTPTGAASCTVQANLTATLTGSDTLYMVVVYVELANPGTPSPSPSPSPSASPSPSPSPSPTPAAQAPSGRIAGPASKCADDSGNSRSKRAKVIIWTCASSDRAEQWAYSGGELQHNGLCLNAKGNAANGSPVILWTCNGSSAEIWRHTSSDSIELKAHGWSLCLTDPKGATKNGTQLVVSSCRNVSDQHWSMP
jgi:Ricin-type beta-trefoil lectin domain